MSARKKVMEPLRARSWAEPGLGVMLVLENGIRIESRGVGFPADEAAAGDYVLIADQDGFELGFWNAEEWAKDPKGVMGAILLCAATGKPPVQGIEKQIGEALDRTLSDEKPPQQKEK